MQLSRILPLAAVLIAWQQAAATPARVIYRCQAAEAVTFSDRPCAAEAQEYEADSSRISTYAPPAAAQPVAARAKQKQRPKRTSASASSQASQAKHAADCDRMRTSLKDIRARMRSVYGAKEGERLKERQARLERRRRAQRCR